MHLISGSFSHLASRAKQKHQDNSNALHLIKDFNKTSHTVDLTVAELNDKIILQFEYKIRLYNEM